jgi:hypothetical protein
MNEPAMLQEAPDISLVLGGPVFQLFRRAHLSGDTMELLKRRIIVITTIAWLPLLILSWLSGHALAGVALPFLHDIETQIRFLIALPILIAAELIVHLRLRPVVQAFVKRNIVVAEEMPKFRAAINSAKRWRDSIPLELALLIFVCTVGHWLWQSQIALGNSSWYATPESGHLHLTPAGYWERHRQNSTFPVHAAAVVSAATYLVPIPLASFKAEPPPRSHSPRSSGRPLFPGQQLLCFRSYSLRPRRHARRPDCQPGVIRGREPAVLQNGSRRTDRRLHVIHSRPTHRVYAATRASETKGGWPITDCWLAAMSRNLRRSGC